VFINQLLSNNLALFLILAIVTLAAVGVLGAKLAHALKMRRKMAERLASDAAKKSRPQSRNASQQRDQLMEKIGRRFSDPNSESLGKLRARLFKAGYYSKTAPYIFIGIRFIALIVPQIILLLTWPIYGDALPGNALMLASGGLAVICFVAPSFMLDKKLSQLEDQYREGFPDMMDLLVACVEAGLSLDGAVQRVAEELAQRYPNLADHLKIMNLETRAGRARTEAWRNFADRLGLDEARALATMLRQSEELGTSVGETLRVFAIDMREKRMLYAEEKALALPAKLVVPLILFVFPSLLTVLMLPAVVRMMEVMAAT
jgi:tight adherence protein C|tara:strand:- start:267 stop:1217 length:951 start_codon:yes stop_codon:yes gene_type:complete